MLHINDLTFRIGGRILLEDATVHIPIGHKVGLIGRNGTGKSTLFKLIAGDLPGDDGAISIRPRARIAQVAQEAPSGPESLVDAVLSADVERASLLSEADTATDPERIAYIHTRLADINSHTAPARAAQILSGLGFSEEAQARPCSDFSGGWQMRVALASTLFTQPDFLLLDEPTNHLDLEATMWLESYLAAWTGTLLVISHDRTLLNTAVDEIIHLENFKLIRYQGNYDRFERTRRERLDAQSRMHDKQVAERKHIQGFVDRFRASASKARQAQSRLKLLEKMEPIASVVESKTVSFHFPNPKPLAPPLINMEHVDIGYDGKAILKDLGLRIDMDDRIALLGANGNGKSTLIKLLAGKLATMDGNLAKSKKLQVGYFAQHQTDELPINDTPYAHMASLMDPVIESKVRAQLGRFGFDKDKADTPIKNLSGGEKARLLFATMSLKAPHIMLLDEPTNHLDVDSREALVHALNDYEGAVVLVSHDPHLIELVCERLWLVNDGTCAPYDGDMADYRNLLLEQRRKNRRVQNKDKKSAPKVDKKAERKARAEARALTSGLRKAVTDAEKSMASLQKQKLALDKKLADPELYDGPAAKVTALQKDMAKIVSDLESTEAKWLEAQDVLEKAEG